LQTSLPFVFAGGDAVIGPSMIVKAIEQGKRAAFYIDRYLRGEPFDTARFGLRLPLVNRNVIVAQAKDTVSLLRPSDLSQRPPDERAVSFEECEITMSEGEARYNANRCLNCAGCSQCQQCVAVCPAKAVDFDIWRARDEVSGWVRYCSPQALTSSTLTTSRHWDMAGSPM